MILLCLKQYDETWTQWSTPPEGISGRVLIRHDSGKAEDDDVEAAALVDIASFRSSTVRRGFELITGDAEDTEAAAVLEGETSSSSDGERLQVSDVTAEKSSRPSAFFSGRGDKGGDKRVDDVWGSSVTGTSGRVWVTNALLGTDVPARDICGRIGASPVLRFGYVTY